jgi:hypothetical protein
MKIHKYSFSGAVKPLWNQNCIVVSDGVTGFTPLIYFQRPKWIEDDAKWKTICESVRLELPVGFEIE